MYLVKDEIKRQEVALMVQKVLKIRSRVNACFVNDTSLFAKSEIVLNTTCFGRRITVTTDKNMLVL